MNKLPVVTHRYDGLFQMLNGFIRSKLLLTGIELKVLPTSFTHMDLDIARK